MSEKTKEELLVQVTTGGSSDDHIETQLIVDMIDSFALETDVGNPVVFVLPTYTTETLPAGVEAQMIYLSDGTSPIAIYNGADWIYPDGSSVGAE